jgi:hypothetical protein
MENVMICHKNKSYSIELLPGEFLPDAYTRLWKIIACFNNESKNAIMNDGIHAYENVVKMSKLWYYKTRMGAKYSNTIEQTIEYFDKKSS